jgi:hypothetical protein
MAKLINAYAEFIDREHNQAVITVRTNLTWYKIAIKGKVLEDITILSAGLERKMSEVLEDILTDGNELDLILLYMDYEAIAIMMVTLFEELN